MAWTVVDLLLVVVALVCLLLTGLSLWRAVKGLTKDLAAAGATVGELTAQLGRLEPAGRVPAGTGRHVQAGRTGSTRVG